MARLKQEPTSRDIDRTEEIVHKVQQLQSEYSKRKGADRTRHINNTVRRMLEIEMRRSNVKLDKVTGRIISEPVIAYGTLKNIWANYRTAIMNLGYKHHTLENQIKKIKKINKKCISDFNKHLTFDMSIEDLRIGLSELKKIYSINGQVGKDLRDLKIEHEAYYRFTLPEDIKVKNKSFDVVSRHRKLSDQIRVNRDWLVSFAKDLLENPEGVGTELVRLTVGLTAATGRRATEILKTASFEVIDKDHVMFQGHLKKSTFGFTSHVEPQNVATLVPAKLVVKALKRLRELTKNDTVKYRDISGVLIERGLHECDANDFRHNKGVNNRYQTITDEGLSLLLQSSHFTIKNFRDIYAAIVVHDEKISNQKSGSKAKSSGQIRADILGHDGDGSQSVYEGVELSDDIETIEAPEYIRLKGFDKPDKALLAFLKTRDSEISSSNTAKRRAVMHDWLKYQVKAGIQLEFITATWIRSNFLNGGIIGNRNSIKKYLDEIIKIDDFRSLVAHEKAAIVTAEKSIEIAKSQEAKADKVIEVAELPKPVDEDITKDTVVKKAKPKAKPKAKLKPKAKPKEKKSDKAKTKAKPKNKPKNKPKAKVAKSKAKATNSVMKTKKTAKAKTKAIKQD